MSNCVKLRKFFGLLALISAALLLSLPAFPQGIGIRMALGADATRILRMVMSQGAWQLAIGLVLITTVTVAWVAHTIVPMLPWAVAFALGAIVSPPDAIATRFFAPVAERLSFVEGDVADLASCRAAMTGAAGVFHLAAVSRVNPSPASIEICTRAYHLLVKEVGFPVEDIIFDPNIFAVATGIEEHNNYAIDYVEATRAIRRARAGSSPRRGGAPSRPRRGRRRAAPARR